MKRTPMKPRTAEMKRSPLKRGAKRLGTGRRMTAWKNARRRVKLELLAVGITVCEIGFEGCTRDDSGGLAHSIKRRHLLRDAEPGSPEHIETVVVSCLNCHRTLDEKLPACEMKRIVMGAIARREVLLAK